MNRMDYRERRPPILGDVWKDGIDEGTSWAFAVVSAIESAYKLAEIPIPRLSAQHLIDVMPSTVEMHTWPALPICGLKCAMDKGLMEDKDYPFRGEKLPFDKKKYKKHPRYGKISSYEVVDIDSDAVIGAIVKQPVVATFEVNKEEFSLHTRGLYFGTDVRNKNRIFRYSTLICGFGEESICEEGEAYEYLLAQNSLGKQHGEDGFMKIVKEKCHREAPRLMQIVYPVI